MTAPGVGPVTRSASKRRSMTPPLQSIEKCGRYVGLTTRRYHLARSTGPVGSRNAAIPMLRSYLYEAAGVLLTRVRKWSALKARGMRLVKRIGIRKARAAVARKLAVVLHRMWVDGTDFRWSSKGRQPRKA